MAFLNDEAWQGKIYSGGWIASDGGATAVIAFTETRSITIRGDIAPYPF